VDSQNLKLVLKLKKCELKT